VTVRFAVAETVNCGVAVTDGVTVTAADAGFTTCAVADVDGVTVTFAVLGHAMIPDAFTDGVTVRLASPDHVPDQSIKLDQVGGADHKIEPLETLPPVAVTVGVTVTDAEAGFVTVAVALTDGVTVTALVAGYVGTAVADTDGATDNDADAVHVVPAGTYGTATPTPDAYMIAVVVTVRVPAVPNTCWYSTDDSLFAPVLILDVTNVMPEGAEP
jgi:hypothetical protein